MVAEWLVASNNNSGENVMLTYDVRQMRYDKPQLFVAPMHTDPQPLGGGACGRVI